METLVRLVDHVLRISIVHMSDVTAILRPLQTTGGSDLHTRSGSREKKRDTEDYSGMIVMQECMDTQFVGNIGWTDGWIHRPSSVSDSHTNMSRTCYVTAQRTLVQGFAFHFLSLIGRVFPYPCQVQVLAAVLIAIWVWSFLGSLKCQDSRPLVFANHYSAFSAAKVPRFLLWI